MTHLRLLDNTVDRFEGEVVAAFFFADERPLDGPQALLDWRLNGLLTQMLLENSARGDIGEHVLVRSNGKVAAEWVLFLGGGERHQLGPEEVRRLLDHLFSVCHRAGFGRVALGLGLPEGMTASSLQGVVRSSLQAASPAGLECLLGITDDKSWLV